MDLKEEELLGRNAESHWYYVSKGTALRHFLGGIRVAESLDVGAGSGVFSRQLLDASISERAVCVDPGYKKEFTESHGGKDICFTRSVDRVDQKLILMMDVLEHVEDDVALLREYSDRMPDDGTIIISVPAFQFLWSGHDVFLEHFRRYTRRGIEKVASDAGLEVVSSRYFFGMLFPVAASIRLVDRWRFSNRRMEAESSLRQYPPAINKILIMLHRLESVLFLPINILAGLTVFCKARRKQA